MAPSSVCVYIYVCGVQWVWLDMRERPREARVSSCVSLYRAVFCIFAVLVVILSCSPGLMCQLHVWGVYTSLVTRQLWQGTERPAGGLEWQQGEFCFCLCLPQQSQQRPPFCNAFIPPTIPSVWLTPTSLIRNLRGEAWEPMTSLFLRHKDPL